jgi:hypothetical protein
MNRRPFLLWSAENETAGGEVVKEKAGIYPAFLFGAVEWTRTITSLRPPAPQAGASTNSATTAFQILSLQQETVF